MHAIVTEIAQISFNEEDSVLHIEMMPDAEMNLEHTRQHYEAIHRLTKGRPYIALINAANYFNIDARALKYSAEQNTLGSRVAAAHYNASVANSLTVSYFKNQLKPGIPVGIFRNKTEALEWIELLKKDKAISLSQN